MRVLVVSHLWPRSDWQNLGVFVREQVVSLAKCCEVAVAVPLDRSIRRTELTFSEIASGFSTYRSRIKPQLLPVGDIHPVNVPFKGSILRKTPAGNTARILSQALNSFSLPDVDIVHAHTIFPDGLACAYWLKERTIPLVVTAHGSDVHSTSRGVATSLRTLFERVDKFVPVSDFLAEKLIDFGAKPERVQTIPNGFPGESFKGINTSHRNPNRIAFLGRLADIKRVDLLLEAVSLCSDNITVDIAGDGPKYKECQALTRKLKLNDRVKFRGQISRSEVPAFLSSAGIMVLVSRMEGWPTVIFEALACGTPVLATAVGGIPEALAQEGLGKVVPADITPRQLAREIESAVAVEWNRQAIIDHAFRFTWQKITDRLIDIYNPLMKTPLEER